MNARMKTFIDILKEREERKQKRLEKQLSCKHEWKSKYEFVYDYDHQDCHKCGASRMV